MRVTNTQLTNMIHGAMNRGGAAMGQLQRQMSSGLRMQVPSDDPIASVRVLRIQREEAALAQYSKNISNVTSSLQAHEGGLRATSLAMLSTRDLLLRASNEAFGKDDLAAMVSELESLERTLVAQLNERDAEGRYRYSGTLTDQPALTFDTATGRYRITGNEQHRQALVADGVLMDENVTAHSFMGPDADLLNDLHSLVAMLKDPALDPADPVVKQQLVATLDQLDVTHNRLLSTVTDLGGRHNHLSLLADSHEDASLINQRLEGELTELDYAGAMIAMSRLEMSMQATQKTYLKVGSLSLFSLM